MKILTSYFYQIRNMKQNYIPLSTAVWDPKWFHQNKGNSYQWKDKNGVWNGLRAEPFVPSEACEGLCRGPETCMAYGPQTCSFLKTYYNQLEQLDFQEIISRFETLGNQIKEVEGFKEEPILVLIFHEKYDNPCSERWPVQNWFKAHDYPIEEFWP